MSREHKGKLTLDALLIMPVQRIPRYELLIKVFSYFFLNSFRIIAFDFERKFADTVICVIIKIIFLLNMLMLSKLVCETYLS